MTAKVLASGNRAQPIGVPAQSGVALRVMPICVNRMAEEELRL